MEIRLYKNCSLTQEYNNVFNSQSVFESYLATLDSTAYNLTLDGVYYSVQSDGTGSIPIDFNYVSNDQILGHINEFNYIRFTDTYYNIVRYCFVTSIAIQNGIAIINYLEDIWHNYVYRLKVDRCIISQKRDVAGIPAKNIIDYVSLKAPIINRITTYSDGTFVIIVKGQLYNTTQSGGINNRTPFVGGLFYYNSDLGYFYKLTSANELNKLSSFIYKSAQTQDSVNVQKPFGNVSGNNNLDITDIYIIPSAYIEDMFDRNIETASIKFNQTFDRPSYDYTIYISLLDNYQVLQSTLSQRITFDTSDEMYKIISGGNYAFTIPISYDGMDLNFRVLYICDGKTFSIFYAINKQIIEITECYNYNFPINIESAENLQLKQINRKLENDTYERNKITLATDTARGTAGFLSGIFSMATGNIGGGFQTMINGATAPVDSFIEIKNAQQKLNDITNAGLYTSNTAIAATSNAFMNAQVDFIIFSVDSTNDEIVNSVYNNFGRVCDVFVDSLIENNQIIISTALEYEYYIIDRCDVTGSASNDVLIMIKNILKRGVRVWRVPSL